MWQTSPKSTVGPIRDRFRVHHVLSPPSNSTRCPVKLILLRSNKLQRRCLPLGPLFLTLWALCRLLCSPERGLRSNNSHRHDKRQQAQPYGPFTLQRITQLPWTHRLAGWRDRGSSPRTRVVGVVRGGKAEKGGRALIPSVIVA